MRYDKGLVQNFSNTMSKYETSNLAELLETHNISPAQFKQIVISEVKRTPKMQEAFLNDPASLFGSILHCAELGLNPSAMMGEFYFIPFKKSIKPILGYKGLLTLLLRSGEINVIFSEIVYEGDEFEFEYGLMPKLIHKPQLEKRTPQIKYVYAVAKLKNGENLFKVMSKSEILSIADMTDYPNDLFFNTKKDPQMWMAKKTVLKQLGKLLPKDYYGKKGFSMDDNIESGSFLKLDEDNNLIVVDGKKIAPTRNKSVYANLETKEEILETEQITLSLELDENNASDS